MRKILTWHIIFICIITLFFLQGCATDKPFVKKDGVSNPPLKVIRYETPSILRSTTTETLLLTAVTVALPGGSALLILGDEYTKARGEDMQVKIPDFGYLVMNKFVQQLNKEKSDWPSLTVVEKPVEKDYADSCTLIEFKVKRIAYGYLDFVRGGGGNGLLCKTVVTMKDPDGEVLWQKSYTYLSKNFNRIKDIDEFEADEGKLLKEEMEFAAEKTVSDLIAHLHGEQSQESVNEEQLQESPTQ